MIPAVLIIEDEAALSAALETALRRVGCAVDTAASGKAGLQWLKTKAYAAVVLDIGLPDMSGLKVLKELREKNPHLPVLVITAHGHLDNAIAARTSGATEYLVKPLDLKHFQQTVRALLEHQSVAQGNSPPDAKKPPLFVGGAASLQAAFAAIARACAGDGSVLITGPSGSGKSLTATIIHSQSGRSNQPLETISSVDLTPESLTKLLTSNPRSTLVMDDITTLSAAAQATLSSLLGNAGTSAVRRVIATTSQDLREFATAGRFRDDLYYLLSVSEVPLPPLRERSSDIPALAASLLARGDGPAPEISPSALAALQHYDWPGNVRELLHVLEYSASASRGRPVLLSHLPPHVGMAMSGPQSAGSALDKALQDWLTDVVTPEAEISYDFLLDHLERSLLGQLLPRYDQKPTRLATALKVHRTTLRQKMARLGIKEEFGA